MKKKLIDNHVLWVQSAIVEQLMRAEPDILQDIQHPSDEVIEWWLVTPFLAKLLWEERETVLQVYESHWWGRKTSGQALYMDEVFARIDKRLS